MTRTQCCHLNCDDQKPSSVSDIKRNFIRDDSRSRSLHVSTIRFSPRLTPKRIVRTWESLRLGLISQPNAYVIERAGSKAVVARPFWAGFQVYCRAP